LGGILLTSGMLAAQAHQNVAALLLDGGRIRISLQWQTWNGAGFDLEARIRTWHLDVSTLGHPWDAGGRVLG